MGFVVDERKTRAGQHDRHAPEQVAVKNFGLREISDFGWTTDIGNGGKQKVLNDGAKQGIWAEIFRFIVNGGEQFGFIPVSSTRGKFSAVTGDRLAALRCDVKQSGAA